MTINWNTSKTETRLIAAAANRAVEIAKKYGVPYDKCTAMMDLTACHANGCPLKLEQMTTMPEPDFAHDVFGIRRHLDRRSGKLKDCFLPRCAEPKKLAS